MSNRKSTRTAAQKRAGRLAASKRYQQSVKGIAKRKLYEAKATRRAYRARWMASPKGQANCHRIKTFNARQVAKDKRRIR